MRTAVAAAGRTTAPRARPAAPAPTPRATSRPPARPSAIVSRFPGSRRSSPSTGAQWREPEPLISSQVDERDLPDDAGSGPRLTPYGGCRRAVPSRRSLYTARDCSRGVVNNDLLRAVRGASVPILGEESADDAHDSGPAYTHSCRAGPGPPRGGWGPGARGPGRGGGRRP